MHTEPRGTTAITNVVVHVNVGPETQTGAMQLRLYLNSIDAGYHQIVDNATTVVAATDNQVVWGASGANRDGLHLCLIGYADQTDDQWHDAYSTAERQRAAIVVANWCSKYQIPVKRLSPAQLQAGARGIVGHVDVTAAYGGNNAGHYDPGPNFPWTEFLHQVSLRMTPPKPVEKVTPMYRPPLVVVGGIAASCAWPAGGELLAGTEGHVYALDGATYLGGPYGHPYWGDRKAAQIKVVNYGTLLRRRYGYCVVATTGERYDFKP